MICATNSFVLPGAVQDRWGRFWQWAQAILQARCNVEYELKVAAKKQALFSGIKGEVLEIGPGTGANLVYLPVGVRWIGVEPNTYMHAYLRELGAKLGLPLDIRVGVAEQLPLPDGTMDAVVGTQLLCSVDDPARALWEIQRVLKPGGRFLFLEQVAAAPGSWLRRWQRLTNPVSALLGDGCHPNRDSWREIEQAGFSLAQVEHFEVSFRWFARPHIAGVAIKRYATWQDK